LYNSGGKLEGRKKEV